MSITQEQVNRLFQYDGVSGLLKWKVKPAKQIVIGATAGSLRPDGYTQIKIEGKFYMAHRIIWLFVYNEWPDGDIDHINGMRADNRLINLRLASRKQNLENQKLQTSNKSGYRGVHWYTKAQKWRVQITHNGKMHYFGVFSDLQEAAKIAKASRDLLFTHHHTRYSA